MQPVHLPAPTPSVPMTLADALNLASAFHREQKFDVAEATYGQILQAVPDCADALHFLGILHHQTGRSRRAVELIRRAIRLQPSQADMQSNLGNVFMQKQRPRAAMQAYQAAIKLDPANANAHNNLGACQRRLGRIAEAEASFRRAIVADPRHGDALNNLGRLLVSEGQIDEAIRCHARAMEVAPKSPDSRRFIVSAYVAAGDLDRALQIAEEWARDEPDSATARHALAAISGRDVPVRASDAFVEVAFDRFAATFDTKLSKLEYRAPDLVAAALGKACGAPTGDRVILDAGCGTGLCGPLLAPFASALSGVDLSSGMLDRARERGCYNALVKAELTQHMSEFEDTFDAVVSADTLCYFGDLDDVLTAAARALRPNGVLVFSVEAEPTAAPFRLNPHGRYSHNADYVGAALARARLQTSVIEEAVLRTEKHQPVHGLVVTARAAPADDLPRQGLVDQVASQVTRREPVLRLRRARRPLPR